jgi:aryl-alcohol dehydrogenase-like predicted oxidoreductase
MAAGNAAGLRATTAGTASFAARHQPEFAAGYFRNAFDLTLSSIGAGTYLGAATDADDMAYADAITHAVARGINVIDTAINYRNQRSERAVGAAIQRLIASSVATRSELVICSKGGYIPLGSAPPATRQEFVDYVQRHFVDEQILQLDEIVGGTHSLAPRFLRYCLAKSRQNLGVRTVDVYYLHNPEAQRSAVDADELYKRIRSAFAVLEDAAGRGDVGVYGVATWNGLRVPPSDPSHLSLERLVGVAREVAGADHHFRAVQLPVNLAMTEGARVASQTVAGRELSAIDAAAELGLTVVGSAALLQSQLSHDLPPDVASLFPGCVTDAQRALAFARTVPGLTTALVGMRQEAHVDENLAVGRLGADSMGAR